MAEEIDQPQSPPPEEADESPSEPQSPSPSSTEEGSEASSTASSADSVFVEDPGPPFDPAKAPEAPPAEEQRAELHALPEPAPEWEQETVRAILTAQGSAVHSMVGVGEQDWVYTEVDLAAIAPPLTRILNRYPATRAAAGTGDELAVIVGLGGYVGRSWQERRAVLTELAGEEEVPVTGVAAPPGTGPPEPGQEPGQRPQWRTGE